MPTQTEFERRIAAIEELVRALEAAADPASRTAAQDLVRSLMDLHAAGLGRVLATVRRHGAAGTAIMEQLGRDELVASLLLLHDLHPVDRETRVRGALDKTRPYLESHGGNVELVGIDSEGVVTLRLQGSCHGCPSSAMTLKLAIEEAIHEAAPDVTGIVVEGHAGNGGAQAPALVTLEPSASGGWRDLPEVGSLATGTTRALEVDGRELLLCRLDESLYAYGSRCPDCGAALAGAALAGRTLACPACGRVYDVVQAGRAPDRPDLHLDPVPLLTHNGRVQVALAAPAP